MSFKEKEVFLISFVYFNYLLLGISAHLNLYIKSKKYKNGHLDYLHNDFASDYVELYKKSGKATMEIKCLR